MPLGLTWPRLVKMLATSEAAQGTAKNVIVVVFDALSAYNISLYGYPRATMPNVARLAQRAIVYHNHFAGGNYTTPGAASLLTGTLPWTHRAIQHNNQVAQRFITRNLFSAFPDYYRTAYTHNAWAYTLLRQFRGEIEVLVPPEKLYLGSYGGFIGYLFGNDEDAASVSWTEAMPKGINDTAYSLFLSHLNAGLQDSQTARFQQSYPRGLPTVGAGSAFLLEQAIDWTGNLIKGARQPFLAYFHFLPPHAPYNTSLEFWNTFSGDRYKPPEKPLDVFRDTAYPDLPRLRRYYDEFLLYVDREFGRFYDTLEASGLLENTWLILTSDHGEMFERGFLGHINPTLYQPLVRVPLLIFEPGRGAGLDIHTPTSVVDLLPTLAHVTGHVPPDWTEGVVLPPYASSSPDPNRNLFAVESSDNGQYAPLRRASTMLVKGPYKLLYFFGYRERGIDALIKLYNIQEDPEELVDLSHAQQSVALELLAELKAQLVEVDQPYL